MSDAPIEIELKFPLKNPEEVLARLDQIAKPISKGVVQKDSYFVPAHRNFLESEYIFEWLRLRETENKKTLNYKHFYPENVKVTEYCEEFQTNIDNVEALKKIFDHLNFRPLIVVDKKRSTWIYKDIEIAIDEVKELGSFIELEAKENLVKTGKDANHVKEIMRNILQELNAEIGDEDLIGYPWRLVEEKGLRRKN